jgi:hypothetical protein
MLNMIMFPLLILEETFFSLHFSQCKTLDPWIKSSFVLAFNVHITMIHAITVTIPL